MNTSLTGRVEGVRSTASDRWASHPLRASLPALRRVSVSAADVSTLVLVLLANLVVRGLGRAFLCLSVCLCRFAAGLPL